MHASPTAAPAPLIAASGIAVAFEGRPVLQAVDIAVHAGEIVTLIGLNGSGKTTLLRVLLGLLRPDAGRVERAPGLAVGYVPQRFAVERTLPLTVRRFLELGRIGGAGRPEAILEEVGADGLLGRQLAQLSGGELQRVLLARALLREPGLLVLDEATASVDVAGQVELYRLIHAIRDRRRCGVLAVSHDLHVVMGATDIVVCLNNHVCCTGTPRRVVEDPAFLALFGPRHARDLAVYAHRHDHAHDLHGDAVGLSGPAHEHAHGHGHAHGHPHLHRREPRA